ncbi:hypothetical protein [Pseudosulfitobacter sp. DSM 107133]|uniref:hypothetical protein n=1 Tax=Pseudosulfitobacter sp. DSM 107133 TaxID=2883100 RepID=UPI0013B3E9AE|nr:hypothetical protein [Pseudosulfitobacter sp. DSM 107133]UOA27134.1 hypothetical protein DSM107133_01845 [Pseudosulfitobacter sp. DSM 107133]
MRRKRLSRKAEDTPIAQEAFGRGRDDTPGGRQRLQSLVTGLVGHRSFYSESMAFRSILSLIADVACR